MLQAIGYQMNMRLSNVRGEKTVIVLAADVLNGVHDNGSAAVV
jgi:hypothetical protein